MRHARVACLIALLIGCRTVGVSKEKGGYAMVKPTVAYSMLLDNRQLVVIDFRSRNEYSGQLGHIAGALSAPMSSIEKRLPEILPYQKDTVLVYADVEEEAIQGAKILVAAGFRNVVLIRGGIREWVALGYKTVTTE